MRNRLKLAVCVFGSLVLFLSPVAGQSLEEIRAARAKELTPRKELPVWADWSKIQDGLAFCTKHRGRIGFLWGTTGLYETLGIADAAPMFAATGLIEKDVQRGMRTAREFSALVAPQESLEAFRQQNFEKARALGMMHLGMASAAFATQQKWDARERRPFNQQAYAMVLMTFSLRPLEILIRQGHVKPEADRAGIEGWMHLWSVLSHGMGLDAEQLGPLDWETARRRDRILRSEQMRPTDGALAQPTLRAELMRAKVRMLSRNSQLTNDEARVAVADALLTQVRLSEGLDLALGLGGEQAREKLLRWDF